MSAMPLGTTISLDRKTDDQFLTSNGVGHHYRPGYYFPDIGFRCNTDKPLPPKLMASDEIKADDHWLTTNNDVHDQKFPDSYGSYGNSHGILTKPPPHYEVHYIRDLADKLNAGHWRRPLDFGNRKSETKEKFQAKPPVVRNKYEFLSKAEPMNYKLKDHHKPNGPSVYGVGSTHNPKLDGLEFFIRDGDVTQLMNPYVTTSARVHRSFKPDERTKYPTSSAKCDRTEIPLMQQEPMIDSMQFKSNTKLGPVRHVSRWVPHGSLKSEMTDKFSRPNHVRNVLNHLSGLDRSDQLPNCVDNYLAPGTYNTEYQNIGSTKIATV